MNPGQKMSHSFWIFFYFSDVQLHVRSLHSGQIFLVLNLKQITFEHTSSEKYAIIIFHDPSTTPLRRPRPPVQNLGSRPPQPPKIDAYVLVCALCLCMCVHGARARVCVWVCVRERESVCWHTGSSHKCKS